MPRLPRFPLLIATLIVVYAAILTVVVSTGSKRDGWVGRLFPSLEDSLNLLHHEHHDQHVLEPKTITVAQTHTVTTTATATATTTVASVQTVTPAIPGPAYCKECGEDDLLCKEYGRHNLERSRGFEGTNARLKRVLQKAASGQPINIGVLGGSVTHGHAVVPSQIWTDLLFAWWNATYPHENNVFVNGAVPATGTAYFSVCALEHIAVAQYYDIPYINLRNVLINHVLEHENLVAEFFRPQDPFPVDMPIDTRHMNRAGHKMMADLLIAHIQKQICRVAADAENPIAPFAPQGNLLPTLDTMEQVPRLRLFERYVPTLRTPTVHSTCMSIRSKKHPLKPSHSNGWSEQTFKDKPYLLAREPGASLTFDIHVGPMGMVEMEYLRSRTFGLGAVWCWMGENENGGVIVDGYWEENLWVII
ncbi:CRISPR-associated endonuclease/helicase Cas3 [Ceratobasidium sp. UAMH 11750]|nr:CRISPR-associated endonuclease/helicase Cas3 [Ceratobasidium sp. UAMH 11750]